MRRSQRVSKTNGPIPKVFKSSLTQSSEKHESPRDQSEARCESDYASQFYGQLFVVKPVIPEGSDDDAFLQFVAKISNPHDLQSLQWAVTPFLENGGAKPKNEDFQKLDVERNQHSSSKVENAIKISKYLINPQLPKIHQVLLHDQSKRDKREQGIFPKNLSDEVQKVFASCNLELGKEQIQHRYKQLLNLAQVLDRKVQDHDKALHIAEQNKNLQEQLDYQKMVNEKLMSQLDKDQSPNINIAEANINLNQIQNSNIHLKDETIHHQNSSDGVNCPEDAQESMNQDLNITCDENMNDIEIIQFINQGPNLHMSENQENLFKIETLKEDEIHFYLPESDIEFIQKIISKYTKVSEIQSIQDSKHVSFSSVSQNKKALLKHADFKMKKWTSVEVGRLIFCLWQIHEHKYEAGVSNMMSSQFNSPKFRGDSSSMVSTYTKNGCNIPFYKSLQDLFNSFDLKQNENRTSLPEKRAKDRTKDIIYSKLQKQRMALSIFEKIVSTIRSKRTPSSSSTQFASCDHKKVDSVAKLFTGIQEFCQHMRETNYKWIQHLYPNDNMEQCLSQFEEYTLPPFLKDSRDLLHKLYVEPLTTEKKNQLYQATTHLIASHQTFSKDDVSSLKEKSRCAGQESEQNVDYEQLNKRKKKEMLKSGQTQLLADFRQLQQQRADRADSPATHRSLVVPTPKRPIEVEKRKHMKMSCGQEPAERYSAGTHQQFSISQMNHSRSRLGSNQKPTDRLRLNENIFLPKKSSLDYHEHPLASTFARPGNFINFSSNKKADLLRSKFTPLKLKGQPQMAAEADKYSSGNSILDMQYNHTNFLKPGLNMSEKSGHGKLGLHNKLMLFTESRNRGSLSRGASAFQSPNQSAQIKQGQSGILGNQLSSKPAWAVNSQLPFNASAIFRPSSNSRNQFTAQSSLKQSQILNQSSNTKAMSAYVDKPELKRC